MTTTLERRVFLSEVETRTAGEGKRVIHGYAYKFNAKSQNLGGFREQVFTGAGKDSIEADDIRALMNHDANLILGRNRAGTLRMTEDSTGLEYEIDADERQSYVRDLLIALERKDVDQSSFGFVVNPDGEKWSLDEDETPLRTLTSIRLFDVSPVTYPAYLSSESGVSKRALDMAASMRAVEVAPLWIPEPTAVPVDPRLALHILRG
ncbi:HK97 family phage prohead protease [Actinoplanes sp. NPDC051470]|uniref:HK97 family phage prohead protease n=1 Tax=Actinoplanes sp. NPDC051470 TaxID=3157224 RepID=UPI003439766B